MLGLRADWFKGDSPTLNPNFVARYGFGNDTGFNDIDPIVLPRLAATYDLNDFSVFRRSKVRGGVGIFSGGDPLVWFGNAFQNDGAVFGQGTTQAAGCPAGQIDVVVGGVFTGVPACVRSRGAAHRRGGPGQHPVGRSRHQDADRVPRQPRLRNADSTSPPGLLQRLAPQRSTSSTATITNPFTIVDLAQAIESARSASTASPSTAGRSIARSILAVPACTGELVDTGSPPVVSSNINAACFSNSRDDELMLTNAGSYNSQIASFILSKNFDGGIFTPGGGVYLQRRLCLHRRPRPPEHVQLDRGIEL